MIDQSNVDIIVRLDPHYCYTYVSPSIEHIIGWTPAKMLGKNYRDLDLPAYLCQQWDSYLQRAFTTGEAQQHEYEITIGNRRRWFLSHFVPELGSEQAEVASVLVISRDITDFKQSQQHLELIANVSSVLNSTLSAEMLDQFADLVVPYLADVCVIELVDHHDEIQQTLVRAALPVQRSWIYELFAYRSPSTSFNPTRAVLAQRQTMRLNAPIKAQDPSLVPDDYQRRLLDQIDLHAVLAVPLVAYDRALGVLHLLQAPSRRSFSALDQQLAEDIAQRLALSLRNRQLYNEAQTAIRHREEFISVAAHEIKSPLTSILGYMQLIQRRLDRDEQLQERDYQRLQMLFAQLRRLQRMISSLLDFSRLETGQFVLHPQRIDLVPLVHEVAHDIEDLSTNHAFEIDCPFAAVWVEVDPLMLELAIYNLLRNAVKYSPDGGLICVTVTQDEQHVQLHISDEGIGIEPELQSKIFERFVRAETPHLHQIRGLGIGLYLVREIVDRHHGSIAVKSTPQVGSTFSITLPRLPDLR